MIIASFSITGMTCLYRTIADEGFHAADFNLIRNIYSFTIASVWLKIAGNKPVVEFPSDRK